MLDSYVDIGKYFRPNIQYLLFLTVLYYKINFYDVHEKYTI